MDHAVGVRFHNSGGAKEYYYLCDGPIDVGAYVVVDTPYGGYTCAKVTSYHETALTATKWIVAVVDTSGYEARMERINRKDILRKQLEKAAEKALEAKKYEFLAEDPDMAKLLEEFKSL